MAKKKLIVVDLSNYIFRAFYAIRPLTAPDGTPVNAVHGVMSMILKLLSQYQPTHVFLAKDTSDGSFRNEMYSEYKANRDDPPDDLKPQFGIIRELVEKMRLPNMEHKQYEADDIIGSAVTQWKKDFDEIYIASSDKDLMQFIEGNVYMLDTMKDKIYDRDAVYEKMGVWPEQIVDYLSIVGDSSDNIPGMRGIGAKGAAKMLSEYKTLEKCIENADKFTNKRVANAFENHVEDAHLSKKLIKIPTDIDLKRSPQDTEYRFHANEELMSFLKELGFNSMIKKLQDLSQSEAEGDKGEFSVVASSKESTFAMKTVTTKKQALQIIQATLDVPQVGLYIDFDDVSPVSGDLVGIGLTLDGQTSYYFPFGHAAADDMLTEKIKNLDDSVLDEISKKLIDREDLEILSKDTKKIITYFRMKGSRFKARVFDVIQAHYVLEVGSRHNLEAMAMQYLDYDLVPLTKDQGEIEKSSLKFATEFFGARACITFCLADQFKSLLEERELESVFYEIDMPCIEILADMERLGVSVNPAYFDELERQFSKELREIEAKVEKEVGETINLKSPKQVGTLLFDKLGLPAVKKTKTGYSTDAEVLEELIAQELSPVPALILKYRELDKLVSTYVSVLPLLVNKKSKRIHTRFRLDVAATGRLSSESPNLQNIPIRSDNGRLIRKGFIAKPGSLLLAADYSQVELRILAHYSNDPTMIKAFKENLDIHTRTASEVLGMKVEEVTANDRSKAKAVNFGLMYGQSSFGLAKQLHITRSEAKTYITNYFERFSKVKGMLDGLKEDAEKTGYSITLYGRKRFLHDIRSTNRAVKSVAERLAINSPIQGTAADIIKKAMIDVYVAIKERQLKSKILLQVHDELIFEVPEDELDIMKKLVKERMEGVAKLKVPLLVDIGIGVNWYDLK